MAVSCYSENVEKNSKNPSARETLYFQSFKILKSKKDTFVLKQATVLCKNFKLVYFLVTEKYTVKKCVKAGPDRAHESRLLIKWTKKGTFCSIYRASKRYISWNIVCESHVWLWKTGLDCKIATRFSHHLYFKKQGTKQECECENNLFESW